MEPINSLTQSLVDDTLNYLDNSPVPNLAKLIHHDELYELCHEAVYNTLEDKAETQAEEDKLEDYDDSDFDRN